MHCSLSSKHFSVHEYQKYLNFGNVERCMFSDIFEAAATATSSTYLTVWLRRRFLSDCPTATAWLPIIIITKSIKLRARVHCGFQLVDNFATLTLINYEGTVYRTYIVMGGSCQRKGYKIDYGILVKLLLTYLHNSFT